MAGGGDGLAFTLVVYKRNTHVALMVTVSTATSQETANDLSKVINPFLLHHPLTVHEDLPTFAFPYSPTHLKRNALCKFSMSHVLEMSESDGWVHPYR